MHNFLHGKLKNNKSASIDIFDEIKNPVQTKKQLDIC